MAGLALESVQIEVLLNGKKAYMGLSQLNKKLKGLNKPATTLNKTFSNFVKLAGIGGLTAMTINAAKLGREMGLISRYTNISTKNLSKMENAFASTGGDAKEVGKTLSNITRGLARLSMGDATFTSRLSAMGINAWDDYGVKNAEQIRLEMSDWIKKQLDAGRTLAEVATFMGDTFNTSTKENVLSFQQVYGLPMTGEVDVSTWNQILRIYQDYRNAVPKGCRYAFNEFFSGRYLSLGMTGDDVLNLQRFLYLICEYN